MWWRSRYSWITESYLVLSWLPLFRRCSVLRNCDNAEDLEWPKADLTFSGSRNGRLSTYLPLSSLVVVWKKIFLTGQIGCFFHFYWQILHLPKFWWKFIQGCVKLVDVRMEKTERFYLGVLLESTRKWYLDRGGSHKCMEWMDGRKSAPTRVPICALS